MHKWSTFDVRKQLQWNALELKFYFCEFIAWIIDPMSEFDINVRFPMKQDPAMRPSKNKIYSLSLPTPLSVALNFFSNFGFENAKLLPPKGWKIPPMMTPLSWELKWLDKSSITDSYFQSTVEGVWVIYVYMYPWNHASSAILEKNNKKVSTPSFFEEVQTRN